MCHVLCAYCITCQPHYVDCRIEHLLCEREGARDVVRREGARAGGECEGARVMGIFEGARAVGRGEGRGL